MEGKQLSEISAENSIFTQENKDGDFGSNNKLRFQSAAIPELTKLFEVTHDRDKFTIKPEWLNELSKLSLAVWWLDDGSIIGNGRKGVLCTDGFSKSSNKTLAHYLKDKWSLKVRLGSVNGKDKNYYRLYFSTNELKKLLRIILPFISVEKMVYKTVLLYKNAQFQQRWISEVSRLSGFQSSTIQRIVENKKSRWKLFRK